LPIILRAANFAVVPYRPVISAGGMRVPSVIVSSIGVDGLCVQPMDMETPAEPRV
jgi:hypothetical protein